MFSPSPKYCEEIHSDVKGGFRRRQKVAWGDSGPRAVLLVFGRMNLSKRTVFKYRCQHEMYCFYL